jgi:hypothetical protein
MPSEHVVKQTNTNTQTTQTTQTTQQTTQQTQQKPNPNSMMKPNPGDGVTGTTGNQGSVDGTTNSKNYYGNNGAGTGGNGAGGSGDGGLSLSGWRWRKKPSLPSSTTEEGTIVFKIKVDEDGQIISIQLESTSVEFLKGFLVSYSFTSMPDVTADCMRRAFTYIESARPEILKFFLEHGADPSYCLAKKGGVHVLSIVNDVETVKKFKDTTFVQCKGCLKTHDVLEGFAGSQEAASLLVERSLFECKDSYHENVKKAFAELKKKETSKPVYSTIMAGRSEHNFQD